MRALLDVGVLIALLDSEHMHHVVATDWLAEHRTQGWATCPLTQNGCIRIVSQPSYRHAASAQLVASMLTQALADPKHEFWPDAISVLSSATLVWENLMTGRHLTDVYLLALAVHHDARLVTLDRSVPMRAVPGAGTEHLLVLQHKHGASTS